MFPITFILTERTLEMHSASTFNDSHVNSIHPLSHSTSSLFKQLFWVYLARLSSKSLQSIMGMRYSLGNVNHTPQNVTSALTNIYIFKVG